MKKQEIVNAIGEGIERNGYTVTVNKVYKGTKELTGLVFKKPEVNIAPTLYIESVPCLEEKETIDEVLDKCIEVVEASDAASFEVEDLFKPENLMICACLASAKEYLNDTPVRIIGDIALYCRVVLDGASCVVRNNVLGFIGLSEEEIFKRAIKNGKLEIMPLMSVLADMMGDIDIPEDELGLMVGTNHDRVLGAGIAFADTAKLRKYKRDFYILPSSIHEVLYVSCDEVPDVENLRNMVREVNDTQVSEEERLSYSVFRYSYEDDTICVA